jgi:tetratricopeptide (TPR) repeat protein/transglutaminase-like putative cysteine protease
MMYGRRLLAGMSLVFLGLLSVSVSGAEPNQGELEELNRGIGEGASDWSLVRDYNRAEETVSAVVDAFYQGDYDLQAFDKRIQSALDEAPHHPALHEVAALYALINGDTHGHWYHFMQAARIGDSNLTELYLRQLVRKDLRSGQREALIELLRNIRQGHTDTGTRAYSTALLLHNLRKLRGLDADYKQFRKQLGFINTWSVVGPFDSSVSKLQKTLENGESLTRTFSSNVVEGSVQFRPVEQLLFNGMVPVGDYMYPTDGKVAYLRTFIHADEPRNAQVRLKTSRPVALWLNGQRSPELEPFPQSVLDNAVADVQLQEGWNRLVVRTRGADYWPVGARITSRDGESLHESLRFDRKIHTSSVSFPDETVQLELRRKQVNLDEIGSDARRQFWRSRLAGWIGPDSIENDEMTAFLERNESNPLALYFAYWGGADCFPKDYQSEVSSLLAEYPGAGSGLLRWQGDYHQGDDETRAAISDFQRAVERESLNRFAWMELNAVMDELNWEAKRCVMLENQLERFKSGWMYYQLGDCYEARDKLDEAKDAFESAHQLRSGFEGDLQRLRDLSIEAGQLDEAKQYAEELVELRPTDVWYREKLAHIQIRRGEYAKAELLLKDVVEQNPGLAAPLKRLAEIAVLQDNPTEAREWLEKVRQLRDDDATELNTKIAYIDTVTGETSQVDSGMRVIEPGELFDRRKSQQPVDMKMVDQYVPRKKDIQYAKNRDVSDDLKTGVHWVDLLDSEVSYVRKDGSAKRLVTLVRRPVSDKGRDRLMKYYLPKNERVEILKAYTETPDGETLEAKSIHDDTVRFRDVNEGSTVVLQYLYYDEPFDFMRENFFSPWRFQKANARTSRAEWILASPPDKKLEIESSKKVKHRTFQEDSQQIHALTIEDSPALLPDPHTIAAHQYLQQAYASTLSDWETYVDWELNRLRDALTMNDAIRGQAEELTEGVEGKQKKLHALSHWIKENIRYEQDYEDKIARIKPHDTMKVLDRKYGDCKDKSTLLIQMARSLGIDARYALIRTRNRGPLQKAVPGLYFNHAIVHVPDQEGLDSELFIDPTPEKTDVGILPVSSQGNTALVIDPDSGEFDFTQTPYEDAEDQYEKSTLEVVISGPNDVDVTWSIESQGLSGRMIRNLSEKYSVEKGLEMITGKLMPGTSVEDITEDRATTTRRPTSIEARVSAADALKKRDGGYRLHLPQSFRLDQYVTVQDRNFPLGLGAKQSTSMDVRIVAKNGARISDMSDPVSVEHKCFSLERTVDQTSKTEARLSVDLTLSCTKIRPDTYGDFRQAVQRVSGTMPSFVAFEFAQ